MASDLTGATFLSRTREQRNFPIPSQPEIAVGYDRSNDVVIPFEGVSRRHARLAFDGKEFWIEDLGSANGTYLNAARVTRRERLKHLDVVTLGRRADLIFVRRTLDQPRRTKRGIVAARLEVLDGMDAGMRREIPRGAVTIGRSAGNNIVADSQLVSKVHARIERSGVELVLTDLQSANGTFVNGERVDSRVLRDGDEVSVGRARAYRVRIEEGEVLTGDVSVAEKVGSTTNSSLPMDWKTHMEWSPEEAADFDKARAAYRQSRPAVSPPAAAVKAVDAKIAKPAKPAKPAAKAAPVPAQAATPASAEAAKPSTPAKAAEPRVSAPPKPPPAAPVPPEPVKPAPAPVAPPKPPAPEAAPKAAAPQATAPKPPAPQAMAQKPVEPPKPPAPQATAPKPPAPPPPAPKLPSPPPAAEPPVAPSPTAAPPIPAQDRATPPTAPPRSPVREPPAARDATRALTPDQLPKLFLESPARTFPLAIGTHEIGRDPNADVRLESSEISRHHARLSVNDHQAILEDLKTVNGTYVNGQKLVSPRPLADGDEVRVGSSKFRVRFGAGYPKK